MIESPFLVHDLGADQFAHKSGEVASEVGNIVLTQLAAGVP